MTLPPELCGLLGMAATGACAAFLYDVLKAFGTAAKLPRAVTDVLFWTASTAGTVAALMYFTGGKLRGYVIAGTAAGAVLYFSTISALNVRLFTVIFKIFFKKLHFIFEILLTPPRFLYKILYRIFKSEPKNKKGDDDP